MSDRELDILDRAIRDNIRLRAKNRAKAETIAALMMELHIERAMPCMHDLSDMARQSGDEWTNDDSFKGEPQTGHGPGEK